MTRVSFTVIADAHTYHKYHQDFLEPVKITTEEFGSIVFIPRNNDTTSLSHHEFQQTSSWRDGSLSAKPDIHTFKKL